VTRSGGDTLERLYQAAIDLIGEHGYAGTTVDEIVARAGVAKGTVYYHFSGKSELVAALLEDGLRRLAASFSEEREGAQGAEGALRALIRAELAYIEQHQAFAKLVMSEMWRVDRDWRDSLRTLRERYVAVVAETIAEGVADGTFRHDLDPDGTASALFGMVATAALDWRVFNPGQTLDEVEAWVAPLALRAVLA
jgi:AcrR family transcriptional regulator